MGEPEGERVAGDAPGALDFGGVDGGVGQPDERGVVFVVRERDGDSLGAPGGAEAGLRGEHAAELGHGEERHIVCGRVVETVFLLGETDGVGERAAAGDDDELGYGRKLFEQARQLRRSGEAAAKTVDFTHMTRKDLLDWVNGKITSGQMSLDDSTAFVAMTAKFRVDGTGPAVDATEQVDFTSMAQGVMEWSRQNGEASNVHAFELALSLMNRYQGEAQGVDRLA